MKRGAIHNPTGGTGGRKSDGIAFRKGRSAEAKNRGEQYETDPRSGRVSSRRFCGAIDLVARTREAIEELRPRDTVDVQSFVWVVWRVFGAVAPDSLMRGGVDLARRGRQHRISVELVAALRAAQGRVGLTNHSRKVASTPGGRKR